MFTTKLMVALSTIALLFYGFRTRRFQFEAERWQHLRFTRALQGSVQSNHCPVFRRNGISPSPATFSAFRRG